MDIQVGYGKVLFHLKSVLDPRSISQLSWQHQLVRLEFGVIFGGCSGFLSTWLVVSPPKELHMAKGKNRSFVEVRKIDIFKNGPFSSYIYIHIQYINFTGSYLILTVNVGCSLLEFLYFTR